jgi:GntR family transcriptional regulator
MNIKARIDRTSFIPLYAQIVESLRSYIESGELQPGAQLPGEAELCQIFDVSRTVIRQALATLEKDTLIVRERHKGTFIAKPKLPEIWFQKLTGFHRSYADQGYSLRSRVLQQELVPAPDKVSERLRIRQNADAILIKRLRYVGDEPIALATSYFPYDLFPRLLHADLSEQSLYGYLETEYGIEITRGHRTFEAVLARTTEAELLEVPPGAPLLLLESVTFLINDVPFEYFKALHRGDRSRFELEVSRTSIMEMQD